MFQDDFNRPDENLEDSPDWTKVDAEPTSAEVISNQLFIPTSTPGIAYWCPDQGSADHYTEIEHRVTSNRGAHLCAVRVLNGDNFIGVQWSAGWKINKYVAGEVTQLGSYVVSVVLGDVTRLSASGNDIEMFVNGESVAGPLTEPDFNTETRQGFVAIGSGLQADNFEADSLGAPPAELDDIYVGATKASEIYAGASPVSAVYVGPTKIWGTP